MENLYRNTINSPVGFIEITTDDTSLLCLSFCKQKGNPTHIQPAVIAETIRQLHEYFDGIRQEFEIKLNPSGTEFQKNVWEFVKNIPFGKTTTYLDIAQQTGSANNSRAVGLANGKNPIPIIIPCHRVIGKNGKLVGYAGGLERKKWLLLHELNQSKNNGQLF